MAGKCSCWESFWDRCLDWPKPSGLDKGWDMRLRLFGAQSIQIFSWTNLWGCLLFIYLHSAASEIPTFRHFFVSPLLCHFLTTAPTCSKHTGVLSDNGAIFSTIFPPGKGYQCPSYLGKKTKKKPVSTFMRTCSAQVETICSLGKCKSNNNLPSVTGKFECWRSLFSTPQNTSHLSFTACFWVLIPFLSWPQEPTVSSHGQEDSPL